VAAYHPAVLDQLAALTSLPVLTTERLTLRPIGEEDADALFAVFSDPEAMRYWSNPPHPSVGETRAMIGRIHEGFGDRTNLQWAIVRDEDELLLGTVTLMPDLDQPRVEIGFILGPPHWGHGYAGEAQRAAIDFAFSELGMHRVEAEADPRNTASIRSLERLGFRREGLMRERWLVAGERTDSLIFGLLAGEWEAAA
jgi:RimJ/RimL family protein N-acetyltransferase